MTKLDLFHKLMAKAKENGYTGPDYKYQVGWLFSETNYYALVFRADFIKAVWGQDMALEMATRILTTKDKWELMEEYLPE